MLRRLSLLLLYLAGAQSAPAQDPSALIVRVEPTIVVLSEEGTGQGSGFVVSSDGIIVTSLHVIAPMKQPRVTLADGRTFDQISILGYDRDRDLAILKIPATGLQRLALSDSGDVKVGERVVAFGAPLGFSGTATFGIVSAIRRHPKVAGATLLQTDAAINPGNSGGPLVNARRQAVGVVVSLMRDARGLGFAVPAEDLRRLLRSSEHSFTPDELRKYLLQTDWAGSILPRRWRAEGDFYSSTARRTLYELHGNDDSIRLTLLRPQAEAWLGSKLVLSLVRDGQKYEGQSNGEVNCETVRESRKVPWLQQTARISDISLDRIEMSFLAPSPPDPDGDCQLKFTRHSVSLVPADRTEVPPTTGEASLLESNRARRIAYEQRRERLRRDCPAVRAKLVRDCTQVTQWNASSCKTFEELAAVCDREGL